jgi:alpha-L-fucosidase
VTMKRFDDGRDWFFEKRFGLFLHWGLYAIDGFHEQDQWRRRIPRTTYEKLANRWNPTDFNPHAWLDAAEAAGMEYAVLTTKHHDGFCLWDTKATAFNTMNTPYGKDIVKQYVDACHERGIPVGLYYSVVDWHHPSYPNQGRHHELDGPEPGDEPDIEGYMDFLRCQVRELCSNYGEINSFWWDMNVEEYSDPTINAMIRELQPNCVINNRGMDDGDFGTPEREWNQKGDSLSYSTPVEACTSVGKQSWGYRVGESHYTDRHMLQTIDGHMAKGGNFLLNVGPCPRGTIPETSTAILHRVGDWMRMAREALYDVTPASHMISNRAILLTRRDNTLYVHLNANPMEEDLILKPLVDLPIRATLLNDGRPLQCANDMVPWQHGEQKGYLRIQGLPVNEFANSVLVVKLEFETLDDFIAKKPDGTVDLNVM